MTDLLLQKYAYYGEIKNTTPPQNNVLPDAKHKAIQAVYNLINSLQAEKQLGRFTDNIAIEDSYNKLLEFYHSLLVKGKRPKFDMYDEAVSDPDGFSILEEQHLSVEDKPHLTKIDKMLITKSDVLKRHLKESNDAVRELKQEIR